MRESRLPCEARWWGSLVFLFNSPIRLILQDGRTTTILESIDITESEKAMVEYEEEINEARIPGNYFLIWRLLSIRLFNSQALINTLTKIWKSAKSLIVDTVDNNFFLFKLAVRGDIDRILEGRSWFFKRHVLLLEEIGPAAQPQGMVLNATPFWLRLYDLPISAWRESTV